MKDLTEIKELLRELESGVWPKEIWQPAVQLRAAIRTYLAETESEVRA